MCRSARKGEPVGLGLLVLLLIGLIVVRILRGVRERGERVTDNAVLIPLVVALGGYMLLRRKEWRAAALLVAALVGANAFYQVTKPLVARARPPEPLHLVGVSGYSFPSRHAIDPNETVREMATFEPSQARPHICGLPIPLE